MFCSFLISLIYIPLSRHLILFDLSTLTILGEQYNLWSCILCNFLIFPVSSCFSGPDILFTTLCHMNSVVHCFINWMHKKSTHTLKETVLMWVWDLVWWSGVCKTAVDFQSDVEEGGVAAYLEENKVPMPFLIMLILQFAVIVVDRALYLRKYILGKIVFQFLLVLGSHIWMFFILPLVTGR